MSITSYQITRLDDVTQVIVTSDIVGEVFFHWYLDGLYMGATAGGTRCFQIAPDGQAEVEVTDTDDPDFDPMSYTPAAPPARKRLWWVRSPDEDTKKYRIEQQQDGGDWTVLDEVSAGSGQWNYYYTTPRLIDLAEYAWRITPIDAAGNPGTPLALTSELFVRRPDAPRFAAAFNPTPRTVTFSEI